MYRDAPVLALYFFDVEQRPAVLVVKTSDDGEPAGRRYFVLQRVKVIELLPQFVWRQIVGGAFAGQGAAHEDRFAVLEQQNSAKRFVDHEERFVAVLIGDFAYAILLVDRASIGRGCSS